MITPTIGWEPMTKVHAARWIVGLGAVLFEKSAWGAEIGALDEEDEV